MIEAPINRYVEAIKPEWIDYNGHLNGAYYMVIFDHATDVLLDLIGLGEAYANEKNAGTFALEAHITYKREISGEVEVRVTSQLIDYDEKRFHYFHRLYHAEKGFLAATLEQISLHVDHRLRRSVPMPISAQRRLSEIFESHLALPRPAEVGSIIGIRRKSESKG